MKNNVKTLNILQDISRTQRVSIAYLLYYKP